ncbi:FtsX-like permease family protein [Paractinoplanes brasiliensis]|uniref:FtsX-like permease family protein n=1 Tax=Paractinoplanes brasiliensis TaxID=52695 RepID=A0A4R6JWR8_9ACTN|nr:FtsX-like permease family protein [Actinoplanes brasiliensis]TDO40312.1 FtsX-like permease family protein [Actinoplanes brasiliensis]GID25377.1 membrane protein [Actinoplanes brasiliensis]
MRRVVAELALGIRLAFPSGRRGWLRTAMASAGVAIGAAALLLGASVPVMLDAREARIQARADSVGATEVPAGRTLIVAAVDAQWGANAVRGRLIWPDSPEAPLPPGVPAFPADRQMYASPALQAALAGPDGDTLRRQMPYEVIGTIGPNGLSGPHEFAYYAGYERAKTLVGTGSWRVDRFGYRIEDEPGAGTYVVVAAMLATLLLPVAIFIGAALRFGAETRDRRLAAIRLVGADSRAVLRIGLGESLVPAVLGLAAGTVLYLMVRGRAADLRLFDVSVFPADIRPVPVLALLVVAVVLALSAGLTLLGFRGVAVEPLGVFRRSATWNGRLWWRLLPPAAGLFLLWPVLTGAPQPDEDRAGLGVVLTVIALIPLVPYVVPLAARVLPGGSASWQLASQQLRQNPAASTRAVTGIVVAVTGAIALHSFFGAAGVRRATPDNPADPAYVLQAPGRVSPAAMRERTASFEQVEGVRAGTVAKYSLYLGREAAGSGYAVVGDCAALRQIAALDRCADGDTFVVGDVGRSFTLDAGRLDPSPGATLPVPPGARPARLVGTDAQVVSTSLLLTPGVVPPQLARAVPWFVETRMFAGDDAPATVAGQLRGLAAEIDPLAQFTAMAPEYDKYASLRVALNLGSAVILLMMGVGLLLDVASRLHDRRRLLGVLAAVGARRSTVIWSVLLQALVPLLAGIALAIGAGAGLGAVLMRTAAVPVLFDTSAVLGPVAVGSVLVVATTVGVLLPAAGRVTSTEQLRYE